MPFIFPGIFLTGAIFIVWDILFTRAGIWGFNHTYTKDFYLGGLPVEEWLFFLIVPYCCFFLYEVLRYFVKRLYAPVASKIIIYVLLVISLIALPLVYQKTYTFTALSFAIIMLILQLIQKTYNTWFSGFLLTFLVSLIPFLIVNGVLTYLPVVWYDNTENFGFRIFTIPPEDMIYLFGMLLPSFNVYYILLHKYAPTSLRTKMKLDDISGF
jgi:lycopene cyclase domain-containing protein